MARAASKLIMLLITCASIAGCVSDEEPHQKDYSLGAERLPEEPSRWLAWSDIADEMPAEVSQVLEGARDSRTGSYTQTGVSQSLHAQVYDAYNAVFEERYGVAASRDRLPVEFQGDFYGVDLLVAV